MATKESKLCLFSRVQEKFRKNKKIIFTNIDHVQSIQMHQVRQDVRGHGEIVMGKNTMIKKALREVIGDIPELEKIMPKIKGNICLVLTNGDLCALKKALTKDTIKTRAKIGFVAQKDISVPPMPTGLDPKHTAFFQTLGISTKVMKGKIEIVKEVLLAKKGEKIGASTAELLNMLDLTAFEFGMTPLEVYDSGEMFPAEILDVDEEMLVSALEGSIREVAAVSLATGHASVASVPHLLAKSYRDVLAVSAGSAYKIEAVEKMLAAAQTAAAPAAPAASAAKEAAKEESEEESDEEMGLGMFD
ncbi:MAG: 60S acidic ribosomal protein P0 [Amphiamblys sp. WSBS2006]|nr:MAG: 60S acidic ribosomal protein P0 [Amphiamblys sp. WSBS2006]